MNIERLLLSTLILYSLHLRPPHSEHPTSGDIYDHGLLLEHQVLEHLFLRPLGIFRCSHMDLLTRLTMLCSEALATGNVSPCGRRIDSQNSVEWSIPYCS